jgi:hypothetical protein
MIIMVIIIFYLNTPYVSKNSKVLGISRIDLQPAQTTATYKLREYELH